MLEYSCVSENLPAGSEKVYGVIMLEKDNTEQPKMKSLDKALKLLECFGSVTPELGITELARIPVSYTHLQAFAELPDHLVIKGAVGFLAVTGDKGDGVSLIQKLDNIVHLPGL